MNAGSASTRRELTRVQASGASIARGSGSVVAWQRDPRRGVAAAALAFACLVGASFALISTHGTSAPSSTMPAGWSALPAAARGAVSRGLGAEQQSYWAHSAADGAIALRNPAQRLGATVSGGRLSVTGAHDLNFDLSDLGVGRNAAVLPKSLSAGRIARNRVTRSAGGIEEWFANGPVGIEQGFTLTRRPAGTGPLLIAQTVSGNLAGHIEQGGGGVSFSSRQGSLSYAGLSVTDAHGRQVPASLRLLAGRRLVIQIDDARAVYPLRVDPVVSQTAELTAADGADDDWLGYSVAISGTTIVAGAPQRTVNSNTDQGAVYVYTMPATGWASTSTPAAELTASDGAANDELGTSVGISGTTIVAGATGTNSSTGTAYVYTMPTDGWASTSTPTAELTASDGATGDALGGVVGISGTTIIASSYAHDSYNGAVYVYQMSGNAWATTSTPTAEIDGTGSELFGLSAAISGSTIVVGLQEPSGNGEVQEFTEPGNGTWADTSTQTATLTAADGATGDLLGYRVAVSGSTIVAGAIHRSVDGHSRQGAIYVWTQPASGGWQDTSTPSAELTASDGVANDNLGNAVAVSGTTVMAASNLEVYEWTMPSGGWANATQTLEPTASDQGADLDVVAADGTTMVAGNQYATFGSGSEQGAVYVFRPAAPSVSIVAPASGASYTQNTTVDASYSCADGAAGTGLSSCVGTDANGAAIDTSTVGTHSFTVTATSSDGESTPVTARYTVAAPTVTTPAPTTTPAPSTPAAPGATLTRAPSLSAATATLTIACHGQEGQNCTGTISATSLEKFAANGKKLVAVAAEAHKRARSKAVVVGRGSFTISAGQTKAIKFKLNSTGNQLLKRFKRLPAKLVMTLTAAGAAPKTIATRTVTFKPAKAKKH
jgi:trimeric autotransporter adhesin